MEDIDKGIDRIVSYIARVHAFMRSLLNLQGRLNEAQLNGLQL